MKLKVLMAGAAVAAFALPAAASAAPSEQKATGGGQILVGARGAGDTIAFTAQGNASDARGQVQYIDRNEQSINVGEERNGAVRFHGIVRCILVVGNTAEIAGHERDTGDAFTLRAVDNGEGAGSAADQIFFDDTADDQPCAQDDDDDDDPLTSLARGNVQIHKAKGSRGASRGTRNAFSFQNALRLARLG